MLLQISPQGGPGHWKINNSILNEENYGILIKDIISKSKEKYKGLHSARLKWDLVKFHIREITIKFCKQRARKKARYKEELKSIIQNLEQECNQTPTVENLEEYEKAKKSLESILEDELQGIIVRAKILDYEAGEKCSKYFFQKMKYNKKKSQVFSLKGNDGNLITDEKRIMSEIYDYYANLYKNNSESETQLSFKNDMPKTIEGYIGLKQLNDEQICLCEGEISIDELYNTLKTFPKNKTPGNDGLSGEFF